MRDKYSPERIAKLHPKVRQTFTDFITECENTLNITLRIIQGLRTINEQNALYAQGRTTKGSIVTNAKGGQSFHNYGLAIDVAEMDATGQVNWNYDMSKLKPIADKYKITWGGSFKSIVDKPHFEINFGFPSNCKLLLEKISKKEVDADGYIIING